MHTPQAVEGDPEATSETLAEQRHGRARRQKRTPDLDAAIGGRLRAARVNAGMSQTGLGDAVGISFQQIQKYELGKDRIAASTLHQIAEVLSVHAGVFFGDEMPVPSGNVKPIREAMAVAADWQRIRNQETRKGLAKLITTLARESQAKPENEG